MIESLLTALMLGLIGGVIPGPVITSIFTEIIQSGILKSLRIVFLGMLTETAIALTCLIGLASFHLPEGIFRIFSLVGAGILVWLATQIWRIKKIDTKDRVHFTLPKIVAMIVANGGLWIFWLTVAIPKAIILSEKIAFGGFLFIIFLEMGWLISTAGVVFIFSKFRNWLSQPHIVPILFKLCALAFVYFAVDSVYQSFVFFLVK